VTPTSQNAKSVKAFKALIDDLQETKIDWHPLGANGTNDSTVLGGLAQQAVDYVVSRQGTPPHQVPAVIVAGGTPAASLVQSHTTTIPIVQAAGGSKPSNAGANMTGFYLNDPSAAKTICQQQYDLLNPTTTARVAVLYDSKNDNATQDILHSLTNYMTPDTFNVVDIVGNLASLTADRLKGIDAQHPNQCTSFMLIPNALFYDQCDDIANKVEQANIPYAIYPEREYKNAHSNKNGKQVHGHKIGLTFGLAAYYVDSLLNDPTCIGTLPWQEAVRDV